MLPWKDFQRPGRRSTHLRIVDVGVFIFIYFGRSWVLRGLQGSYGVIHLYNAHLKVHSRKSYAGGGLPACIASKSAFSRSYKYTLSAFKEGLKFVIAFHLHYSAWQALKRAFTRICIVSYSVHENGGQCMWKEFGRGLAHLKWLQQVALSAPVALPDCELLKHLRC